LGCSLTAPQSARRRRRQQLPVLSRVSIARRCSTRHPPEAPISPGVRLSGVGAN
jgi:hypothetical protein